MLDTTNALERLICDDEKAYMHIHEAGLRGATPDVEDTHETMKEEAESHRMGRWHGMREGSAFGAGSDWEPSGRRARGGCVVRYHIAD